MVLGSPTHGGLCVPSIGIAAVCVRRGRTSCALICLQKTVYGANVIVFEGILAFANKELLKVSLPDAPSGPSRCMVWEEAHRAALRVTGTLSWPSPCHCWGLWEGGSPAACWQSTSVSEDSGVSAGCHCCGGQSWLDCGCGERGGAAKGVLTPPSFSAPGHEGVCGHGLRHPSGAAAATRHHGAWARHRGRHQAIPEVCEAGL